MKDFLAELFKSIENTTPGVLALTLMDSVNDVVYIAHATNPNVDMDTVSKYYLEIYKQVAKSLSFDENQKQNKVKEIMIMTEKEQIVFSTTYGRFVGVLVGDSNKINIGVLRATAERVRLIIGDKMKHLL